MMTPAARIQAAIDVLAELEKRGAPADRALEAWGRANRFAGAKDRAAIAEHVFSVLRRRAEIVHRMNGAESPRALAIGMLLVAEQKSVREVAELFSAGGYGPAPLTFEERKALLNPPEPPADLSTRYNVPGWILPQLEKAFGRDLETELAALSVRAPLDIRANLLKTTRERVEGTLAADHIETRTTPWSPLGLRIADPQARQVTRTEAFKEGQFEIQDDGAQCASLLLGAERGETIVDLCAGAGGKSLAIAAAMENEGRIVACDVEPANLDELRRRATRAGARNIETRTLARNWTERARGSRVDDLEGQADRVLVDAPCSGSGTWRRSPWLKWRLTAAQLNALRSIQLTLLEAAARLVRPGGLLLYVTCSLLPVENEEVATALLSRAPDLNLLPAAKRWPRFIRAQMPTGVTTFARLSPASSSSDGFFLAAFEKRRQ